MVRSEILGLPIPTSKWHRQFACALTIEIDLAHDTPGGLKNEIPAVTRYLANEPSNTLAPFQRICTPMHTSKNDDNRMITLIPVAPRNRASLSANP